MSIVDSDGVAVTDAAWRPGAVRESIVYNGTGDTAPVVSKTKADPWRSISGDCNICRAIQATEPRVPAQVRKSA